MQKSKNSREGDMMVEEAEETKNENLNCTYVSFNFHAINKNKALCWSISS